MGLDTQTYFRPSFNEAPQLPSARGSLSANCRSHASSSFHCCGPHGARGLKKPQADAKSSMPSMHHQSSTLNRLSPTAPTSPADVARGKCVRVCFGDIFGKGSFSRDVVCDVSSLKLLGGGLNSIANIVPVTSVCLWVRWSSRTDEDVTLHQFMQRKLATLSSCVLTLLGLRRPCSSFLTGDGCLA